MGDSDPRHGESGTDALPRGLLESFLPRSRRDALAEGRELPDRVTGAALFADISGFTALAEALVAEHGRHRGAEEVDSNLNRVYEAIIGDLASFGGEVFYLSGDAITCWLDGDDGSRAIACALAMQSTMRSVGDIETTLGGITLSIKVAVAVGAARRFVVGDPSLQRMDVLAGRLIDDLAAAESLAEQGDVIADESTIASLGDRLVVTEPRTDPEIGRSCGVVGALREAPVGETSEPAADLAVDVVRPWLIPEVFDRLAVGGGTFLGELRSAYPIFIRFAGFEFDDDPDVAERVDEFVCATQHALDRFGGTLLGITVGDKGAYINAVVGAPRSHEDDALRAVSAAIAIRQLEASTEATGIQVGVSHGPIYAGTYGHTDRRTYTVLGDPTNTAARLMVKAGAGQIYVLEEVAAAVDDRFLWAEVEPLALKGKALPVQARVPIAARSHSARRVTRYELPLVGRERELDAATHIADEVRSGSQRVLAISADAGLGKSRFIAELLRRVEDGDLAVAYGEAEPLERTGSYVVWRPIWRRLFGLDEERSDEEQAADLERLLRTVDESLVARLPLLGGAVGVEIPDNDLVASFDAKLRKASLENLLGEMLVTRLGAGPLVIVLEDVQWIDPLSTDLLIELVRRTIDMPVLFVLSFRNDNATPVPDELLSLAGLSEIELGEVDRTGMEAIVASKVGQVFGTSVAPSVELRDVILDRSQGNPFYAEELVNYVHRLGVDPTDASVEAIELPSTLQAIVLERIDGLDERPRQAVKVASVAGRRFDSSMLGRVHEPLGGDVQGHLDVARRVDLVTPEDEELADWLFRHALTREVAYESLPFAVRRTLHERIGDRLAEEEGSAALAALIADHYWHGESVDKQRTWLRVAGDAAAASYANDAAIEQYRRLVEVALPADRPRVLLDLAAVFERVGQWDTALETATEARELADVADDEVTVGWADVAIAEIERKRGRYDDANHRLEQAEQTFTRTSSENGVARVSHLRGTIAAQQGDLAEARRHYEASREVRERLGDRDGLAGLLSNLGVVAEYEEDFAAARRHHEAALALRRELDDRWAIAVSYTNLGMIATLEERHDDARQLFEESRRLSAEVGDTWMIAISENNLGNATRGLGQRDAARSHYAAALALSGWYRDLWALAFLFEDIALLALDDDPPVALRLIGAADRWRAHIDVPRPASIERSIENGLDAAGAIDTAAGERERGAASSDDEALAEARRYCSGLA